MLPASIDLAKRNHVIKNGFNRIMKFFNTGKLNLTTALVLALAALSCKERPAPVQTSAARPAEAPAVAEGTNEPAPPTPGTTTTQVFLVRGVVKEVMLDKNKIKIAHETIPNYMEAMTMVFDVRDTRALGRVKSGDSVFFRLVVTEDDGWIEQMAPVVTPPSASTNASPQVEASPTPTFRRALEVEPLKVGDPIPNYSFTNQSGKPVSLHDFNGEAVAITFIFTRCPFPTFCPRMSSLFAEAQKKLKAREGAPDNWRLLTISFDPEFDTPSVLRSYAQRYGADPEHWSFLTGDLIDITALAEQVGQLFWRPDPTNPVGIEHNLRTLVIDAQGKLQRVIPENEWKADELVAELVKAANAKKG